MDQPDQRRALLRWPAALGETVADLVGIEPDYVFVTTFWGVEQIAKDVGPITVDNPIAFSDEYLKPKGFPAGKVVLRGYNVVAFGRIRHSLAGGDFDRSRNQQRVLKGFQAKVAQNADKPAGSRRACSRSWTTSTPTFPGELRDPGGRAGRSEKITGCVVPGASATWGRGVVLPYTETAKRYGDDARKDASIKNC